MSYSGYLYWLAAGLLVWGGSVQAECTLSLSQPDIAYGTVRPENRYRHEARPQLLPERHVTLQVTCDEIQEIAVQFSAAGQEGQAFSFGQKGSLNVSLTQALLDGHQVQLERILPQHQHTRTPGDTMENIRDGDVIRPIVQQMPVQGKQFRLQISVQPQLTWSTFLVKDKTRVDTRLQVALYP